MRNLRQLRMAFTLSVLIGAGMVTFSPNLNAAIPGSPQSIAVRCALLQRAINAATAVFGADSDLVAYLEAQYAAYCGA
jgi:hypothetical protein